MSKSKDEIIQPPPSPPPPEGPKAWSYLVQAATVVAYAGAEHKDPCGGLPMCPRCRAIIVVAQKFDGDDALKVINDPHNEGVRFDFAAECDHAVQMMKQARIDHLIPMGLKSKKDNEDDDG